MNTIPLCPTLASYLNRCRHPKGTHTHRERERNRKRVRDREGRGIWGRKREKMKESSQGMVETMNTYWWGKKKRHKLQWWNPPTVTRPHLNDSCVGPHGALTLLTVGNFDLIELSLMEVLSHCRETTHTVYMQCHPLRVHILENLSNPACLSLLTCAVMAKVVSEVLWSIFTENQLCYFAKWFLMIFYPLSGVSQGFCSIFWFPFLFKPNVTFSFLFFFLTAHTHTTMANSNPGPIWHSGQAV